MAACSRRRSPTRSATRSASPTDRGRRDFGGRPRQFDHRRRPRRSLRHRAPASGRSRLDAARGGQDRREIGALAQAILCRPRAIRDRHRARAAAAAAGVEMSGARPCARLPAAMRSSPAPAAASARRSRAGSPPRARASRWPGAGARRSRRCRASLPGGGALRRRRFRRHRRRSRRPRLRRRTERVRAGRHPRQQCRRGAERAVREDRFRAVEQGHRRRPHRRLSRDQAGLLGMQRRPARGASSMSPRPPA